MVISFMAKINVIMTINTTLRYLIWRNNFNTISIKISITTNNSCIHSKRIVKMKAWDFHHLIVNSIWLLSTWK